LDVTTKVELLGLLEPVVAAAGYELLEIDFSPASGRALLRLFIDRTDDSHVTLDDCEIVSRAVGTVLDAADPIERAYELEVSSPGFDRPLRTRAHFERFLGSEARVELVAPVEGRRRFRGVLKALADEDLVMEVDGREWRLPLGRIGKARLVA
jgi:ribosome maturation factor RimP